jgi:UDP:flavonoid glycosyltransferase YjiC (YdhE family)
MPDGLAHFLDDGPAPVVFTLGTSAVGAAGRFYHESAEAARRLGVRAVLLVGTDPANRPSGGLPPGVIAVEYAPHAELFPRAAVVVHQGGVGTTGQALKAGRPTLVVPYAHDQPDNAWRVTRLGVARTLYPKRYTAKRVERELVALLGDSAYGRRAAEVAAVVRSEDGVATACDAMARVLEPVGAAVP